MTPGVRTADRAAIPLPVVPGNSAITTVNHIKSLLQQDITKTSLSRLYGAPFAMLTRVEVV